MPAFGENQAFAVHVQDSVPQIRAQRRRNRSVLETTMVFRTSGDSATQVRAENASGIRISVTGSKPGEAFEATAYGRSPYNVRTAVTITHHDVNLALDARRPRPLVRFVSVGPISEEDLRLAPGEIPPPYPYPLPETSNQKIVKKMRPVSAPAPSAEAVKAMLDAPANKPFAPARPTTLRIFTDPLEHQYEVDRVSIDSPRDSLSPFFSSFRPHQFGGGRSVDCHRVVLNEPLPSLCPRSPSECSFAEDEVLGNEEDHPAITEPERTPSEEIQDNELSPEIVEEQPIPIQSENNLSSSPSFDSFNDDSLVNTVEGDISPAESVESRVMDRSQRSGKVISLTKAVKLKLYGSRQTTSSSTLALSRSSMSPPPSAFQRFERALGAAAGSSASLSSRVSLKNSNGVGPSSGGKSMKALLGKAMGIGKGMKRSREEEENMAPDSIQDGVDRPIAGRRTKRKLMGISVGN
ncbi:hypothetical protein F5876DRAFT_76129 [Lentinula aff. lateritia]|uniref:Uncharacterized protein n=1 Tax=Lentinula aff. lateritia TaxID=2804960 RepID=A0ACC1U2Q8_9AGAR|nr:hypothetical protein F5876DRAFT_76129 [Lentinula aff. lateritia]